MLLSYSAQAHTFLNPEEHHFVTIDASGSYDGYRSDTLVVSRMGGGGASIGVGYRYYRNQFLFATSLQCKYTYFTLSMNDMRDSISLVDSEGDPFLLRADATQCSDRNHALHLQLPLLFGMEWKRFYFLVGPMFSMNVFGRTIADGEITTSATYPMYNGMMVDMPTHNLTTQSVSHYRDLRLNFDLLAHLEVGWRLGRLPRPREIALSPTIHRYYIALFADIGCLNIQHIANKDNLTPRLWHETTTDSQGQPITTFNLTPTMMSRELYGRRLTEYYIGVKFTAALELPQKQPCVICNDKYLKSQTKRYEN
ncbi:MAG: hypothetical protein ACI30J_01500 [Paludibacteraceae bacterium]